MLGYLIPLLREIMRQLTFPSLNKDARSIPWICVQVPANCTVLSPPCFLLVPLSPRSVTIKDRSHVSASRLSIVQRSSRVSRFSHKTHGTTFDWQQSVIIIRVPGDLPRGWGPIWTRSR